MQRICILTIAPYGGGAEKSMQLLNQVFQTNGMNSQICTIYNLNDGKDINHHSLNLKEKNILSVYKSILKLRIYLTTNSFTTLIVNCELSEFFSIFAPRSVKKIVVLHNPKPWKKRKFLGILTRLTLFIQGVKWISVSERVRVWPTNLKSFGVIPNLFKLSSEGRVNLNLVSRLVFVGRLINQKDPVMFCRIAELSKLETHVIGDGPLRLKLSTKYSKFAFHGYVQNPWELISDKDILLFCSESEGDGLALLEAIDRGCAILVRDTPDYRRFKLPNNNYFFTEFEALQKIRKHVNNPFLELNEQINSAILLERNPKLIYEKWLDLLQE